MAAEEKLPRHAFGAGPGAVRFISGHLRRAHGSISRSALAAFHGREAAMIFSSAYAAIVSTIVPLVTSGHGCSSPTS